MADDRRTIAGKVRIESESAAATALELARLIAGYESEKAVKNEEYWIRLYRRCFRATHDRQDGNLPERS